MRNRVEVNQIIFLKDAITAFGTPDLRYIADEIMDNSKDISKMIRDKTKSNMNRIFPEMDAINGEVIKHESAGGVVFHFSPTEKTLWVALVQKQNFEYFLPKGHLKTGESPYEAAIREIKEELSLDDDLRLIGELGTQSYTFFLSGDEMLHNKDVHLFVFSLEKKSQIKPRIEENFIDARWVKYEEAEKIITYDQEILKKAKRIFESYHQ
jgi:8-oxo-dGTP pyrophosphatase MutT (NUDIX family)